jgi:hypothetical protein
MSDAQTVASDTIPSTPSLESLDSSQFDHWRMTGELPSSDSSAETPPADSSPAKPAEQADQTESLRQPASEPGKPSKPNAETRKPELENDIQTLLQRRAALRAEVEAEERRRESLRPIQDATPAESSPATAKSLLETIQSPDIDRPPLTDTQFFELHPEATMVDLARYATQYQTLSFQRSQRAQQEQGGRVDAYTAKMAEAIAADPQFWSHIDPRLMNVTPSDWLPSGATRTAANDLAQEILTSAAPAALLKHLTANPEELHRLLASPNAVALARGIGRIEASLTSTAPQPAPAGDPVSLAPPPSPTLGKKPAQPVDELAEAIKSGDFARYKELTDRKELRTA